MKIPGMLLLMAVPLCVFAQSAPKQENKFVGSTVCKTCHPDVWLNFNKNPHFKSIASGMKLPIRPAAKGAMARAAITWPRAAASPPSGPSR